jgi:hypothetical protein
MIEEPVPNEETTPVNPELNPDSGDEPETEKFALPVPEIPREHTRDAAIPLMACDVCGEDGPTKLHSWECQPCLLALAGYSQEIASDARRKATGVLDPAGWTPVPHSWLCDGCRAAIAEFRYGRSSEVRGRGKSKLARIRDRLGSRILAGEEKLSSLLPTDGRVARGYVKWLGLERRYRRVATAVPEKLDQLALPAN